MRPWTLWGNDSRVCGVQLDARAADLASPGLPRLGTRRGRRGADVGRACLDCATTRFTGVRAAAGDGPSDPPLPSYGAGHAPPGEAGAGWRGDEIGRAS